MIFYNILFKTYFINTIYETKKGETFFILRRIFK